MIELFRIGFLNFTIIDLLDIGVVTVLFFWIYRALKDTVAVQILFGLVIIIGLSFITEAINLKSFNWILHTISNIWLIAFIVLFQPELRRLMLLITRTPVLRFLSKARISETLDEVVDAVIELSEKHTGALIVFTRSQNVEMTVDTGVQLQAMVSRELLLSVFNTRSPLHDGAVIIENQLIIAARCVLPLSSVTRFDTRILGTRHRAGLGLSEQIDAVVLIVSEETGGISIAEGGVLTLDIPKKQLHTLLNNRLSSKS